VAQAVAEVRAAARGFVPIAVDTLMPIGALDFDLYIRPSPQTPPELYREASYPLEQADLDRLSRQEVHTLYIPAADCLRYQKYLQQVVVRNERLRPTQRFVVLKNANRAIFESAFRSGAPERMVQFADEFGRQLIDLVCRRETVLYHLFRVMDHDYYTYTHLTNVCTYSVALTRWLGIRRSGLLRRAGGTWRLP